MLVYWKFWFSNVMLVFRGVDIDLTAIHWLHEASESRAGTSTCGAIVGHLWTWDLAEKNWGEIPCNLSSTFRQEVFPMFFPWWLGKGVNQYWSPLDAIKILDDLGSVKWQCLNPLDFLLAVSYTLLETNISQPKVDLKMIFLFPRWDMYPFPGGYPLLGGS